MRSTHDTSMIDQTDPAHDHRTSSNQADSSAKVIESDQ